MKARPRHVEGEIAKRLSLFYSQFGYKSVERIPVLGRTGPDIEVNEMRLAVDVKSRIQVPKSMIVPPKLARVFDVENQALIGVSLESLALLDQNPAAETVYPGSKVVLRWLLHMQAWADANACTAALVLHRPKLAYSQSTFIIFQKDWRLLCQQMQ